MNSKKLVALLAATAMTAGMVAGCGSSTDTAASTAASTASSEATSEAVTSEAAASSEAAETSESATTEEASADADQLPRDQTLYFSGQQWGSVNDYNPLSGNSNNGMVLAASTFSRILVYETLMMYDPLTTECKPLLATDYSWNDDHTEMTVHLNPDAKWSDGTQVTSADIAYTWEAQKKYNTAGYGTFSPFIDTIEAVDDTTFTIKMVLNDDGKPVNYKYGEQYLISPYQMQKAYLQKVEERDGEDADKVTTDRMDDLVASGPYKPYIDNDQKVVLIRDDNYWGQADSMWGKLPVPKYIAHAIYKDNAAGDTALRQGEVMFRICGRRTDSIFPHGWTRLRMILQCRLLPHSSTARSRVSTMQRSARQSLWLLTMIRSLLLQCPDSHRPLMSIPAALLLRTIRCVRSTSTMMH